MRKVFAEGRSALSRLVRRQHSRYDSPPPSLRRLHSTPEPLESRIAPASTFSVTLTSPADGAALGTSPGEITVDFSNNVLLPTLQASDLLINNVPATGFTIVDGDTVRFTVGGQLSSGTHTISIAEGALQDVQGVPISAFSAQFTLDRTAPRVISTSVQPGDVLTPGAFTYVVQFDERMAVDNLSADDFTLFAVNRGVQAVPSSFSYNAAGDTLTINYSNLTDDRYILTLLSGDGRFEDRAGNDLDGEAFSFPMPPNVSGNGTAGGDFAIAFSVDVQVAPFSGTFQALQPSGSLVQKGTLTTSISTGGDVDTYTLALIAGQKITLVAEASATLRPAVSLFGPNGAALGSNSGATGGSTATLQTITVPETGLYSITLNGVAGTTGLVTLQALINAAVETEGSQGGGNETRGTAQNINGSFIDLGGNVSRGVILGTTDLVAGSLATESEPNNTTSQANLATANFVQGGGNQLYSRAAGSFILEMRRTGI